MNQKIPQLNKRDLTGQARFVIPFVIRVNLFLSLCIFVLLISGSVSATTVISEDFNDRSYSSPLSIWTSSGYDNNVQYSSSENHSGSSGYSLVRDDSYYNGSGFGSQLYMNSDTATHMQQGVYFRYYRKYASNYCASNYCLGSLTDNDKWVKVSGSSGNNIEIVAYYSDVLGYNHLKNHTAGCESNNSMRVTFGQWDKIEMYFYVPLSGGTPLIHIQVNDNDIIDRTCPDIVRGIFSSVVQMFGGVRASNMGGAPSGRGYRYFDDLTVVVGEGDLCDNEPSEQGQFDLTPPSRSNPQPTGTLTSGTTSTTISLDTDETAICKYDTASGVTFDQQQFTFDTTGSTSHSQTINNLSDGDNKTYYVRCQDEAGNANTDDFEISFDILVDNCSEGEITETCICNGAEHSSGYCCTGIWDQNVCRLHYENFDNQIIDNPSVGSITVEKGFWPTVNPSDYNMDAVGHGGSGYCLSGAQNVSAYLVWWYGQTWPTDEMYVSFYQKFASYGSGLIKNFYPHWDGTNSMVLTSLWSNNTLSVKASDKNKNLLRQDNITCNNQCDGNWHHYEYWVQFSTGLSRMWYDGVLKVDDDWGSGTWTNAMYYITMGSANNGATDFLRQFDDWEVWDGMPGASDTTPPSRSNPQPTGTLTSGTTSTIISLDTDETAECKYSDVANTTYDNMLNVFATTDSTDHSTDVTDLSDGNSYTYYICCQDEAGNANPDNNFTISFSIASPSITYSISNFINLVSDWLKTESGLESDVNGDGVVNTRDLGIMMSNWQN